MSGNGNTIVNTNDTESFANSMNRRFEQMEKIMKQRQKSIMDNKVNMITNAGIGSVFWPGGGMITESTAKQTKKRMYIPPMRNNMKFN